MRQLVSTLKFDSRKKAEEGESALFIQKQALEKALEDAQKAYTDELTELEKNKAKAEQLKKQLDDTLASLGVEEIKAVGEEFNPNFHNAVMQVESEEYEEGIVAQELLKGYMYRETVVRHSMVAVAQ